MTTSNLTCERAKRLFVKQLAWDKMHYWAGLMPKHEVGGMLLITEHPTHYLVEDCCLLKQEVSAGEVKLDPDALAQFMHERFPDKYMIEPIPYIVNGCWHSHHSLGAFFSPKDDGDFIEKQLCRGPLINIVISPTHATSKVAARLDMLVGQPPFDNTFRIVVPLTVEMAPIEYDDATLEAWLSQLEALVTKEKPPVTVGYQGHYGYYGGSLFTNEGSYHTREDFDRETYKGDALAARYNQEHAARVGAIVTPTNGKKETVFTFNGMSVTMSLDGDFVRVVERKLNDKTHVTSVRYKLSEATKKHITQTYNLKVWPW